MTYFLDTSALAKLYHREVGTGRMVELFASPHILLISDLARLEFVSTVMRRRRSGDLDYSAQQALLDRFLHDTENRFTLLPFSPDVVQKSIEAILAFGDRTPLRSLDAIQYGFFDAHCESGTTFVCADDRLLQALTAAGVPVLNPIEAAQG